MQRSSKWQSEFVTALLDPEMLVPPGLINPSYEPSPRRFGVYRNNVIRGLVEALKDSFPVTCRIVGVDFFDAMAHFYAVRNPPSSPILLEYGADFADFFANFQPAAGLPYLSDVCRIERSWLEAYHAPEVPDQSPDQLSSLLLLGRSGVHADLHPSVRLLSSRFPAITIWSTNIEGAEPVPVDLEAGGDNGLIVRPGADVELFILSEGEMAFVRALVDGSEILNAAESALRLDPDFSLSASLQDLIERGVIVGYRVASTYSRDSRMGNA